MASKSPQKKKGKSKRAHVLVAAVERATANFVERGQQIAAENPEVFRLWQKNCTSRKNLTRTRKQEYT